MLTNFYILDIDKIKITKEEFVELLLSQGILDALSDIMLKEKVEDNQLKVFWLL